LLTRIDAPVARALENKHPGWRAAEGACPECIHLAAAAARLARSRTSIQDELMLPYPVYEQDETGGASASWWTPAQYSGQGVTLAFLDPFTPADLTRPENRILCYVDASGATGRERQFQQAARHQLARLDDLLRGCRQRLYVRPASPQHCLPGEPGVGQDGQLAAQHRGRISNALARMRTPRFSIKIEHPLAVITTGSLMS
jgi:hypothetical protein